MQSLRSLGLARPLLQRLGGERRALSTLPEAISPSRLHTHYNNTLVDDLSLMLYKHDAPVKEPRKGPSRITELTGKKDEQYTLGTRPRDIRKRAVLPPPGPPSPSNVPRIEKIVVHSMSREVVNNKFSLLSMYMSLQSVTGVRPQVVKAKTDVSPWHLRQGNPVGCKVVLEGERAYAFLERVTEVVLPKLKEWYPVSAKAGDGYGTITLGFPGTTLGMFPEIEDVFDMYPKLYGFEMAIVTSATTNAQARCLLSGLGLPIAPRRPRPAALLAQIIKDRQEAKEYKLLSKAKAA
ncbi:MAG: ribosomal protein L5 domain-containing protein [Piptocephalis tieghemiana]|nr:MAG: ribosomal protein L5 domain-containing protein [Piptocephalis tieghemiana]